MNKAYQENALCPKCKWAKDKVNNCHVTGCYCTEYGYIVSHPKTQCRGYEQETERAEREA